MRRFRERMRRKRHQIAVALMVASVVAVLNAAAVFACTAIMGPFLFSPTSGPPGTVLITSASGLKPYPARYNIYFGGECMTFTGKLVKVVAPNLQGAWSGVKMTIPKKAKPGTYSLCGVEAYPVPGQTATSHTSFTVV